MEILKAYTSWAWANKSAPFGKVDHLDAFYAGWRASEACTGVDQNMVRVDLQDFARVAQKLPDVTGEPIYYAVWPKNQVNGIEE